MRADRQTDTHTYRHAHHNTSHLYTGAVGLSAKTRTLSRCWNMGPRLSMQSHEQRAAFAEWYFADLLSSGVSCGKLKTFKSGLVIFSLYVHDICLFLFILLWPPCGIGQAIIYLPCGFFFYLSSSFFLAESQPSQSGCLYANLECRSEMCCTRLARNTGRKNDAKIAIWAPSHNFVGLNLPN